MEKLIEALKTIKAECEKHVSDDDCCQQCPFGTDDGVCCVINTTPDCWYIVEQKTIVRVME